jgi:FMN-dependent NADH-azoreductase
MAHLLHIDSSIQGDRSVSRRLTARAKDVWRAAHPGRTVTYRDLGSNPLPHFDAATGLARLVPPEQRTPAQVGSWALTEELVGEIREADTILLGLPLYNFGAPSSVKTWVDHLIAPGLSHDPETKAAHQTENHPADADHPQQRRSAARAIAVKAAGTARPVLPPPIQAPMTHMAV